MKARSGTVFHKSPDFFLLKEKNVSRFLNDYCSTYCIVGMVRRDLKTTLSGRSSGRALIKKSLWTTLRSTEMRKDFLRRYYQRCGSILAESANDGGPLDILLRVSIRP